MANSVHLYGLVLRREDGHVLRRALDFEVECQRMKGRLKRTWKKQVEEDRCEGWFSEGKMHFADQSGVFALI